MLSCKHTSKVIDFYISFSPYNSTTQLPRMITRYKIHYHKMLLRKYPMSVCIVTCCTQCLLLINEYLLSVTCHYYNRGTIPTSTKPQKSTSGLFKTGTPPWNTGYWKQLENGCADWSGQMHVLQNGATLRGRRVFKRSSDLLRSGVKTWTQRRIACKNTTILTVLYSYIYICITSYLRKGSLAVTVPHSTNPSYNLLSWFCARRLVLRIPYPSIRINRTFSPLFMCSRGSILLEDGEVVAHAADVIF